MVRHTLAAAGLLLTATVALAPRANAQQLGRDDSVFTWSKQLGSGARLTINNGNGPIEVHESTSGKVEVHARKVPRGRSLSDVAFAVKETSNGVTICTLVGDRRDCDDDNGTGNQRVRVDFDVSIPRDVRMHANSGNGDITIDRAGSDVVVNTGNGKITVGQTTGRVEANTGNGDVRVEGASGPVNVNTGNGRVSVATSQGGVSASSGNGDIDVQIKALTSNDNMEFTTGNGSIRVTLPADYNGRVDATSGNGPLESDFDISVVGRLDAHHIRGTIGKGGSLLRLTTGAGRIELKKG